MRPAPNFFFMNEPRDSRRINDPVNGEDSSDPMEVGRASLEPNGSRYPDSGSASDKHQSFKRRNWGKLLLLAVVGLPVLVAAIWTFGALNWSYSSGDRAGYVQKISRKGYVCKTWEGVLYTDIAKGFRSDSFQFSVRNDSIAHMLESLSGRKVSIRYEQHVGVPTSCFGESEYFVSGVRALPE